jgi:hypothetical protein
MVSSPIFQNTILFCLGSLLEMLLGHTVDNTYIFLLTTCIIISCFPLHGKLKSFSGTLKMDHCWTHNLIFLKLP